MDGSYSFNNLTFATTGDYVLEISGADAAAMPRDEDITVIAAYADVQILSPADNATLFAVSDGDSATANIYETTFTVSAPNLYLGKTMELRCGAKPATVDGKVSYVTLGKKVITQSAANIPILSMWGSTRTSTNEMVCQVVISPL